jgi:ABC-2 type transport system ATP-binding protein
VLIINAGRITFSRSLEELEGERVILVEVRGPADQVAGVLRGTPGVSKVVGSGQDDGVCAFEVHAQDDRDVREALAQALMHRGWPLRRLERKRRKLEDAFFEVIRGQVPTGPATPPVAQTAITRQG